MIVNEKTIDSIIFDMDGTLWDATASYGKIWDVCFAETGIDRTVTAEELTSYMGMPIIDILDGISSNIVKPFDKKKFIERLSVLEDEMMPTLGGIPYEGVVEGLRELSRYYKLLMMSNCGANGLRNFMDYTNTANYFTDSVTYGERNVPKGENIKYLIEKNKLKNAVYVGDVQGDCDEAHRAGIPFVFANYGFGSCNDYELSFDSFKDMYNWFIKLKE